MKKLIIALISVLCVFSIAYSQDVAEEVGVNVGWPSPIPDEFREGEDRLHNPGENEYFIIEQSILGNMVENEVVTLTNRNVDGGLGDGTLYDQVDYIIMSDLQFGGDDGVDADLIIDEGVTIWFGYRTSHEFEEPEEDDRWLGCGEIEQICKITFEEGWRIRCNEGGGNQVNFAPWVDLGGEDGKYLRESNIVGDEVHIDLESIYQMYPPNIVEDFWEGIEWNDDRNGAQGHFCAGGFILNTNISHFNLFQ
ncbi:MAG: hypothetical protein P9X24_09635 [Candidatus Hatepunaea meridiana]|nr:hypothetical protein [Candidatus Hatepunaea meridiana]